MRGHASQESLQFLAPLYVALQQTFTCHIGDFGQKEKAVTYVEGEKTRFIRFDFCIDELKLIFEYDGAFYHDRSSYIKDMRKNEIAETHGYQVVRLDGYGTSGRSDYTVWQDNCDKIVTTMLAYGVDASSIQWQFKRKVYYDKKHWQASRTNLPTPV